MPPPPVKNSELGVTVHRSKLQELGQDREALIFYKKVLQLKPNDPQTLLYLTKLLKPRETNSSGVSAARAGPARWDRDSGSRAIQEQMGLKLETVRSDGGCDAQDIPMAGL